jgi:hypothetical protein
MNYQRIYDQIIDRAKKENRKKGQGVYYESHHIIPKCLGGRNEKENLVELTAREHFLVHHLLIFIYPDNKKLAYAFWGMCNQTGSFNNVRDYEISSRSYETGRDSFIKAVAGRPCTWGDKISKKTRGISRGNRAKEAVEKQKKTVAENPYRHSKKSKQSISEKLTRYVKTQEHRNAIATTLKAKGIKPPSQAKPITLGGKDYTSIKEACETLSKPRHVVMRLLKAAVDGNRAEITEE